MDDVACAFSGIALLACLAFYFGDSLGQSIFWGTTARYGFFALALLSVQAASVGFALGVAALRRARSIKAWLGVSLGGVVLVLEAGLLVSGYSNNY